MIEVGILEVAIFMGIATASLWAVLFLGFLFGYRNQVNVGQYFRAMFYSYRHSEVRVIWKAIILGFEYIIGLIFSAIVLSAWYIALGIRFVVSKIVFSKVRRERLEIEKLADK